MKLGTFGILKISKKLLEDCTLLLWSVARSLIAAIKMKSLLVAIFMLMNTVQLYNCLSIVYEKWERKVDRPMCDISPKKIGLYIFKHYLCNFTVTQIKLENSYKVILDKQNLTDNRKCTISCLSGRNIKIIKQNTFKGLTNLCFIDLSHNRISLIDREVFNGLKSLRKLNLAHNKIYLLEAEMFNDLIKLKTLYLHHNLIHTIQKEVFVNLTNLKCLQLDSNSLTKLTDGMFVGLKSLEKLNLKYNERLYWNKTNIQTIEKRAFVDLIKLERLDFYKHNIHMIEKETFIGLKSLKELCLDHNSIEAIEERVFTGLTSLKELSLSYNDLQTIEKGAFDGLQNIETLDLTHNNLQMLQMGVFVGLPKLEILLLQSNDLHIIEPGTFANLTKLKQLRLDSNSLHTTEQGDLTGLISLERLTVRQNSIQTVRKRVFTGLISLKMLYLSRNKINAIEKTAFDGLVNLTSLSISHNRLHMIQKGVFTDLIKLQRLELRYNMIQTIEKGTFEGLINLNKLLLYPNNLTKLTSGMFMGLNNLKKLDMKHHKKDIRTKNHIHTIETGAFLGMKDMAELTLCNLGIHTIQKEAFVGLINLKVLSISYNNLQTIEKGTFTGPKNLEKLDLAHNNLQTIQDEAFTMLINLKKLDLSDNNLCIIGKGSFTGLKQLHQINLCYNVIQTIEKKALLDLSSLRKLDLSEHNIHMIENTTFIGPISLVHLNLSKNSIYMIAEKSFVDLKSLKNLWLCSNNLTTLTNGMFMMLKNLEELDLSKNNIKTIEKGTFVDLTNLEYLNMYSNELTQLSNGMFIGLTHLECLNLMDNGEKNIEQNICQPAKDRMAIYLGGNDISDFSWTLLMLSLFNMSLNVDLNYTLYTLYINSEYFKCTGSICWMKHLNWSPIYTGLHYDSDESYFFPNVLENECNGILEQICPSKEIWCMDSEKDRCDAECTDIGNKGGKLVIDGDVCPFQYFCQCECFPCVEMCASEGKTHVNSSIDIHGCSICDCQCPNPNCWKTCNGDKFLSINNTFGCPECQCLCSETDCDAKCNGTGITRTDSAGCLVCDGCKSQPVNEKKNLAGIVVAPSIVSILVLSVLAVVAICICKRNKTKLLEVEHKVTLLDTLTQNLHPDLAQQVKECWVDPIALCAGQLIGNGHFGIVWSGTYERAVGRKFSVAIKVAKAEYHDIWTVERKWNSKHELKPQFEKRPVQVKLNNQIIEDLLMEAIVMKKFKHPNMLSMFGISVHEEKPCIILPLMSNGDLKQYLKVKNCMITIHNLLGFALGVAKGMTHLAERNYVHCDLAARNCMLDSNLIIKISDFGLTRDISDKGYHKSEDTTNPIPIRWMSIEAIQSRQFTMENDVWSYGVVLWEIFSYGEFPYANIENVDVLRYLMNGYRLEKPSICTDNIYGVMLKCWRDKPEERPNMNEILNMINKVADTGADYAEVNDESVSTNKQESDAKVM